MADETTQAPVAGTTENNATQQEKKMYVYYFSDPDAATKDLRFHAIYTEVEFSELPWHVHTEKPDESLKDPVWSLEANGWVENSKDGQAQILAEAQAKIVELDKSKEQFDQINNANARQTQMLTEQLGNQAKQNQNLLQMMGQMQQTLAILAKKSEPTQPTSGGTNAQTTNSANTDTTTSAETTNTTVNGGNN